MKMKRKSLNTSGTRGSNTTDSNLGAVSDSGDQWANEVTFSTIESIEEGLSALAKVGKDDFERVVEELAFRHEGKHTGSCLETSFVFALLCVTETKDTGCEINADILKRSDEIHVTLFLGELYVALTNTNVLGGKGQDCVIGSELAV